ncbi:MAG: hypothetical protein LBO81_05310 [Clostridiales Family XIII bacterium]|jgi:hypothetical protein|nr:hypothetical protein [Clostridiales Family XIII bacterium]
MKEAGIKNLRNQAVVYGVGIMALCGLISLPVLGVNLLFVGGLIFGTAVSVLNISLLAFFTERSLLFGKPLLATVGLVLRMSLCGAAFVGSVTALGDMAGFGTAVGFVTVYAAVFWLNGVRPHILRIIQFFSAKADGFPRRSCGDPEYIYENAGCGANGERRYVFVKSFSMTKYRGGRTYVTCRRFRKLKEIRRRQDA